jgi:hypothetical protein
VVRRFLDLTKQLLATVGQRDQVLEIPAPKQVVFPAGSECLELGGQ